MQLINTSNSNTIASLVAMVPSRLLLIVVVSSMLAWCDSTPRVDSQEYFTDSDVPKLMVFKAYSTFLADAAFLGVFFWPSELPTRGSLYQVEKDSTGKYVQGKEVLNLDTILPYGRAIYRPGTHESSNGLYQTEDLMRNQPPYEQFKIYVTQGPYRSTVSNITIWVSSLDYLPQTGNGGHALKFDGIDDIFTFAAPKYFDGNIVTFMYWLRGDRNGKRQTLLSVSSEAGGNELWASDDGISIIVTIRGITIASQCPTIIDGRWHHFALVLRADEGTLRLVLDARNTQCNKHRILYQGGNGTVGFPPLTTSSFFALGQYIQTGDVKLTPHADALAARRHDIASIPAKFFDTVDYPFRTTMFTQQEAQLVLDREQSVSVARKRLDAESVLAFEPEIAPLLSDNQPYRACGKNISTGFCECSDRFNRDFPFSGEVDEFYMYAREVQYRDIAMRMELTNTAPMIGRGRRRLSPIPYPPPEIMVSTAETSFNMSLLLYYSFDVNGQSKLNYLVQNLTTETHLMREPDLAMDMRNYVSISSNADALLGAGSAAMAPTRVPSTAPVRGARVFHTAVTATAPTLLTVPFVDVENLTNTPLFYPNARVWSIANLGLLSQPLSNGSYAEIAEVRTFVNNFGVSILYQPGEIMRSTGSEDSVWDAFTLQWSDRSFPTNALNDIHTIVFTDVILELQQAPHALNSTWKLSEGDAGVITLEAFVRPYRSFASSVLAVPEGMMLFQVEDVECGTISTEEGCFCPLAVSIRSPVSVLGPRCVEVYCGYSSAGVRVAWCVAAAERIYTFGYFSNGTYTPGPLANANVTSSEAAPTKVYRPVPVIDRRHRLVGALENQHGFGTKTFPFLTNISGTGASIGYSTVEFVSSNRAPIARNHTAVVTSSLSHLPIDVIDHDNKTMVISLQRDIQHAQAFYPVATAPAFWTERNIALGEQVLPMTQPDNSTALSQRRVHSSKTSSPLTAWQPESHTTPLPLTMSDAMSVNDGGGEAYSALLGRWAPASLPKDDNDTALGREDSILATMAAEARELALAAGLQASNPALGLANGTTTTVAATTAATTARGEETTTVANTNISSTATPPYLQPTTATRVTLPLSELFASLPRLSTSPSISLECVSDYRQTCSAPSVSSSWSSGTPRAASQARSVSNNNVTHSTLEHNATTTTNNINASNTTASSTTSPPPPETEKSPAQTVIFELNSTVLLGSVDIQGWIPFDAPVLISAWVTPMETATIFNTRKEGETPVEDMQGPGTKLLFDNGDSSQSILPDGDVRTLTSRYETRASIFFNETDAYWSVVFCGHGWSRTARNDNTPSMPWILPPTTRVSRLRMEVCDLRPVPREQFSLIKRVSGAIVRGSDTFRSGFSTPSHGAHAVIAPDIGARGSTEVTYEACAEGGCANATTTVVMDAHALPVRRLLSISPGTRLVDLGAFTLITSLETRSPVYWANGSLLGNVTSAPMELNVTNSSGFNITNGTNITIGINGTVINGTDNNETLPTALHNATSNGTLHVNVTGGFNGTNMTNGTNGTHNNATAAPFPTTSATTPVLQRSASLIRLTVNDGECGMPFTTIFTTVFTTDVDTHGNVTGRRELNVSNEIWVPCPPGSRCDPNTGRCEPCPEGTFGPEAGVANNCVPCPPGLHSDGVGASKCVPCPGGQFSSDWGQPVCLDCPAGMASSPGSIKCSNCKVGYFAMKPRTPVCHLCGSLGYADKEASTQCNDCPAFARVTRFNADSKSECVCQPGTYSLHGPGTECVPCPIGAQCHGRHAWPQPLSGFYTKREWWTNDTVIIAKCQGTQGLVHCDGYPLFDFTEKALACTPNHPRWDCPRPHILDNGSECKAGYEGNLCSRCGDGFWRSPANTCMPCPLDKQSPWMGIPVFCLIVLGAVAWYFILVLCAKTVPTTYILVTHCQLLSVLAEFNVPWPDVSRQLLSSLAVFNFNLAVLPWSCTTFALTWLQMWNFSLAIPILFVGAVCVRVVFDAFWRALFAFGKQQVLTLVRAVRKRYRRIRRSLIRFKKKHRKLSTEEKNRIMAEQAAAAMANGLVGQPAVDGGGGSGDAARRPAAADNRDDEDDDDDDDDDSDGRNHRGNGDAPTMTLATLRQAALGDLKRSKGAFGGKGGDGGNEAGGGLRLSDALNRSVAALNVILVAAMTRPLQGWACASVPGAAVSTSYLIAFPDMACSGFGYDSMLRAAVLFGGFYLLAVPIGTAFLMYRSFANDETHLPQWKARYGWLTKRYTPQYWYWELVVLTRKLLIVTVVALGPQFPKFQVYMAGGVGLGNSILQIRCRPFRRLRDNTLETILLLHMTYCALAITPDLETFFDPSRPSAPYSAAFFTIVFFFVLMTGLLALLMDNLTFGKRVPVWLTRAFLAVPLLPGVVFWVERQCHKWYMRAARLPPALPIPKGERWHQQLVHVEFDPMAPAELQTWSKSKNHRVDNGYTDEEADGAVNDGSLNGARDREKYAVTAAGSIEGTVAAAHSDAKHISIASTGDIGNDADAVLVGDDSNRTPDVTTSRVVPINSSNIHDLDDEYKYDDDSNEGGGGDRHSNNADGSDISAFSIEDASKAEEEVRQENEKALLRRYTAAATFTFPWDAGVAMCAAYGLDGRGLTSTSTKSASGNLNPTAGATLRVPAHAVADSTDAARAPATASEPGAMQPTGVSAAAIAAQHRRSDSFGPASDLRQGISRHGSAVGFPGPVGTPLPMVKKMWDDDRDDGDDGNNDVDRRANGTDDALISAISNHGRSAGVGTGVPGNDAFVRDGSIDGPNSTVGTSGVAADGNTAAGGPYISIHRQQRQQRQQAEGTSLTPGIDDLSFAEICSYVQSLRVRLRLYKDHSRANPREGVNPRELQLLRELNMVQKRQCDMLSHDYVRVFQTKYMLEGFNERLARDVEEIKDVKANNNTMLVAGRKIRVYIEQRREAELRRLGRPDGNAARLVQMREMVQGHADAVKRSIRRLEGLSSSSSSDVDGDDDDGDDDTLADYDDEEDDGGTETRTTTGTVDYGDDRSSVGLW